MDFKKHHASPDDEGRWVNYGEARIHIVKPGTRKAEKQLQDLLTLAEFDEISGGRKHFDSAQDPELQRHLEERFEMLARKTASEFINLQSRITASYMIGWDNVDEDGKRVPFSHKKAVEYLAGYKEFREFIDMEAYKLVLEGRADDQKSEDIKKN